MVWKSYSNNVRRCRQAASDAVAPWCGATGNERLHEKTPPRTTRRHGRDRRNRTGCDAATSLGLARGTGGWNQPASRPTAPDRTPGDTAAKRRSRVANIAKQLPKSLIVYFIQCICVAINAMNPVASPVREICSADGGREQIVPIPGLSSDVRSYSAFHPHQALSPSTMPSCHNSKASSRRGISLLDTQPKHKHMRPKSHTQSWPCNAQG